MFSRYNVARLGTISRSKATGITTIVRRPPTLAGGGMKCQDFSGRRGFEERPVLAGYRSSREGRRIALKPRDTRRQAQ
jgi:hypothetical protein